MEWLLRLISRLPIPLHYWFADRVIYPLCYHVVRYRRRLVEKNLRLSFPEKSEAERQALARAFYHHLANIIVEVIYGYSLSEEEMAQHAVFHNHETIRRLSEEHGCVIVMLAHLGNWEWLTDYNQHLERDGMIQGSIFRRQKNSRMDSLLDKIRRHRGGLFIEKNQVLRQMVVLRREGRRVVYGFISDQKPRPDVTRFWTEFLHQETGFLDGSEVLGKKFGYPVVYAHISRPERGRYDVRFEVLAEHPQETAENEITRMYAERLEQNIREQPEIWLWTHNRWKWGRPQPTA